LDIAELFFPRQPEPGKFWDQMSDSVIDLVTATGDVPTNMKEYTILMQLRNYPRN
jgi:hypothetical protein